MSVESHLALLGFPCRDKVTGVTGVVTHVGFDLYGCIQAIMHPGVDSNGAMQDTIWFDVTRLEIVKDSRVMPMPDFEAGYIARGLKGPSEKPKTQKY